MACQCNFLHRIDVAVVPLREYVVLIRNGAQHYGLAAVVLATADYLSERIVVAIRFDGIYLGR